MKTLMIETEKEGQQKNDNCQYPNFTYVYSKPLVSSKKNNIH